MPTDYTFIDSLIKTKTMPQQNMEEIIALEAVLPMIKRSPDTAKRMIELVIELLKYPALQKENSDDRVFVYLVFKREQNADIMNNPIFVGAFKELPTHKTMADSFVIGEQDGYVYEFTDYDERPAIEYSGYVYFSRKIMVR